MFIYGIFHLKKNAWFKKQSAVSSSSNWVWPDLTTAELVLFLCNPYSVHFSAIASLPELHFDALHQPAAKSIAGAEGRMTAVILLFFNSAGYRHHTDKSRSKKTMQNAESRERSPRRLLPDEHEMSPPRRLRYPHRESAYCGRISLIIQVEWYKPASNRHLRNLTATETCSIVNGCNEQRLPAP